jgi:hypothetical protein
MLQLGGVTRVNEVRINPLLKFEQVLWNRLLGGIQYSPA